MVPNGNYEKHREKSKEKSVSKFVHFNRKKYVYTYESNRMVRRREDEEEEEDSKLGNEKMKMII